MVDCYAKELGDPSTNPVFQFLRERKVKKLLFVCLTHPHDDHYRGMSQLLTHFQVQNFWRFAGYSDQGIAEAAAGAWQEQIENEPDVDEARSSLEDLVRTLRLVAEGAAQSAIVVARPNITHVLYQWTGQPGRPDGEIRAVAPSQFHRERYTTRAEAGAAELRHNDISLALIIRYGQRSVFLGGDVENDNWDAVFRENRRNRPRVALGRAAVIKVCHHGSANGFHLNLWQRLCGRSKKTVAVITPYQRFGHPSRQGLDAVARFTARVYVTNRTALSWLNPAPVPVLVDPTTPPGRQERIRQRLAHLHRTGAIRTITPIERHDGRCSVHVPPTARTGVAVDCAAPAGAVDLTAAIPV